MKVNVEISMGEYFDKITILKIKQAHGIGDSKELDMLLNIKQDEPNSSTISSLVGILLAINSELWNIEDGKRQCEKVKDFGTKFIELSRSVYILNDMRADVKRKINELTNSDFIEYKSHSVE